LPLMTMHVNSAVSVLTRAPEHAPTSAHRRADFGRSWKDTPTVPPALVNGVGRLLNPTQPFGLG
jgi:hypothetical protein